MGYVLLPVCLTGIVAFFLTPSYKIQILLLCLQFASLAPLVVLVMCQLVSFSGHLHHIFFMDMDMSDAVAFWVFHDLIGARLILHIQELIYLHIVLDNPISLLCHSIISLTNLLWFYHNTFFNALIR